MSCDFSFFLSSEFSSLLNLKTSTDINGRTQIVLLTIWLSFSSNQLSNKFNSLAGIAHLEIRSNVVLLAQML